MKPPVSRKQISSTLLKGLDTLTLVSSRPEGVTLPEIVEALNEPRSNVLRLVESLSLYGLIRQQGRHWKVTEALQSWAVPDRHFRLQKLYRPVLESVARATGELVLLGIHEGNGIVHLDYIESDQTIRVAPAPHTRHNLRHNAIGKLALSRRPDLWEDLEPSLAAELEKIRETGVAWNREESVQGMVAMARSGFTDLATDGMIAVAWPAFRFSEKNAETALAAIEKAVARKVG